AQAQKPSLSIITASKAPLSELTQKMKDPRSSAFFNVFTRIRIGLFDGPEASDFVKLRRPGIPPFSTEEKTGILAFARRHPLGLQIGCYHVLEARQWGTDLDTALEDAREAIEELITGWPKWE